LQENLVATFQQHAESDCTRQWIARDPVAELRIFCPEGKNRGSSREQTTRYHRLDDEHYESSYAEKIGGASGFEATTTISAKGHWLRDACGPAPHPAQFDVPITVSTRRIGNRLEFHLQSLADLPITAYAYMRGAGGANLHFVDARISNVAPMKPMAVQPNTCRMASSMCKPARRWPPYSRMARRVAAPRRSKH